MAEDDEAHRKVAVKVSGALGAVLLTMVLPFAGWGVAGRGSWQATAAFGFAAGLLIASLSQGLIWYLMHVRRPIVEPEYMEPRATTPLPVPASEVATLPTREEIETKVGTLREYKDQLDRFLTLAAHGDGAVYKGEFPAQLQAALEKSSTYLDLKLYPISKLIAETGVYSYFTTLPRESQPRVLVQAMGVLLDMREKLPKPRTSEPSQPNVPPSAPAELDSLLSLPPKEAVRTAWQQVEASIAPLVEKEGLGSQPFDGALAGLVQRGYISAGDVSSITGLRQMFRLTEGPSREVTQEKAREFLRLAEAILWLVRDAHRKRHS